jgi:tripartite-type tricarboxylate transporter receptor subunit TctC
MKPTQASLAALVVSALALGMAEPASAQQSVEQFYKGKVITLYIGFAPGGSYDYYGHEVARYIGRYIPGNPQVVAQSMPGAGSFQAANYLFNVAPKDGTALGIVTQTLALEEALGTPGVRYKATQFGWVGRVTSILEVSPIWHTAKAKTIEDAKKIETPFASTGAGSPSEGYPKLMNAVAGTKFKVVTGYPGSSDGLVAMERGEVDTCLTSWNTIKRTKQDWLKEKKATMLVQYAMQRSPDLPDVPTLVELGKNDEDRQVLAFYVSGAENGRSIITTPGVPAERLQALRRAFDGMLKDKDFLADIEKSGSDLVSAPGEEIEKIIAQAASAPKAVIDRTRAAIAGQ